MNLWFVFWVFIAIFILGTSLWSYTILMKQKRVWGGFAKKHNLAYSSAAVLKSPVLQGIYNGIRVEIFSDKQISGAKVRDGAMRTIFQLTLKAPMPTVGAIGSMNFKNFISGLDLPHELPVDAGLSKDIFHRVQNLEPFQIYMTKERIPVFNAVMTIKNTPALLIFNASDTILRIESPDPFDDAPRLEKFLTKITEAGKILSV